MARKLGQKFRNSDQSPSRRKIGLIIVGIDENSWDMGSGSLVVQGVSEQIAILSKSLDQVEAVAQNKDGESGSERLAADELQQLLTSSRLVVDGDVEQIQEQNVERTSLGSGGDVHEGICRQGWRRFGKGIGNRIKIVNIE